MKILRRHEVIARTGLSNPTIWRYERDGAFPKRIQLGPNAIGWIEDEVDAWIASRRRGPIAVEAVNALRHRTEAEKSAA